MDERESPTTADPAAGPNLEHELPPGSHPLEVGARRGIGPLSPHGQEVWHGDAVPCVSCGQLVPRDAIECDQCAQDLTPAMLEKMRAHAGPWYVLEHIRPFPGVSLDRIVRQVHRGLITETSIVRGPSTDYQWRFAVETPGLCRYFGRCWSCHGEVSPSDGSCRNCLSYLSFEKPRAVPDASPSTTAAELKGKAIISQTLAPKQSPERERRGPEATGRPVPAQTPTGATAKPQLVRPKATVNTGKRSSPTPPDLHQPVGRAVSAEVCILDDITRVSHAQTPSDHLKDLSAVVDRTALPTHEPIWDEPPRIAGIRVTWVAVALLAIVIVALMFLTQSRSEDTMPKDAERSGIVQPAP